MPAIFILFVVLLCPFASLYARLDSVSIRPVKQKVGHLFEAHYHTLSNDSTVKWGKYEAYFDLKRVVSGNYNQNMQHGNWKRYYPDGNLMIDAQYILGRKHGRFSYYYANGNLSAQAFFNLGKKVDTWKSFFPNNTLRGIREYQNDTLIKELVYYENGLLCRDFSLEKLETGDTKTVEYENFPSGKMKYHKTKINDTLHGEFIYYHESGIVWFHQIYVMGKLMEVRDSRAPEGTKQQIGDFDNGTGTLRLYHSDGSLHAILNYKKGLLRGKAHYFEKGTLRVVGHFFDGKQIGTWLYYNKNKKLRIERNYYDGSGPYYEIQFSSGQETFQGEVENKMREGKWLSTNYYGEVAYEEHYHLGLLHGPYKKFYASTIQVMGGYYYGEKVGQWQTFNKKKQLTFTENHNKDVRVDSTSATALGILETEEYFNIKNQYAYEKPWQSGAFAHYKISDIEYFINTISYPAQAKENKVKGNVRAIYIIDEFGWVQSPAILQGIGYGCDEEVLRVLSHFPPYTPTFENGMPIVSGAIKEIEFQL